MFHVKQEKRALASANLIYEGLCQCMTQKEFAQITIQDIQIASTVSRSTFYRHFDSLTDYTGAAINCSSKCSLIFNFRQRMTHTFLPIIFYSIGQPIHKSWSSSYKSNAPTCFIVVTWTTCRSFNRQLHPAYFPHNTRTILWRYAPVSCWAFSQHG